MRLRTNQFTYEGLRKTFFNKTFNIVFELLLT